MRGGLFAGRSYKGSHLALLVELLAGPLVGAAVADKLEAQNWGNLVLAIDPGLMGDAAAFKKQAAALLRRVQKARPLPGWGGSTLPGRRGDALAGARQPEAELCSGERGAMLSYALRYGQGGLVDGHKSAMKIARSLAEPL